MKLHGFSDLRGSVSVSRWRGDQLVFGIVCSDNQGNYDAFNLFYWHVYTQNVNVYFHAVA